ncbi:MAG TPA: WecB/TagA/CpsF family glycosyltransferase [Gracilimonas sp.]|uniref:WecB/TagA/CpsF family glycosyltransferase n=1 Tax=Gracilimonas sp. TaxID=1974203 RepID=UPI002DA6FCCE|nr:WecB/TagA/CpsF family glycosyltransferase [Gracilimonas sp.]
MNSNKIESSYFLGVRVDRLDTETAKDEVRKLVRKRDGIMKPVYFANVHSIFLALQDHQLMEQLNYAALTLPDGSGLNWAGKILGNPIVENLNGTDFTPKILEMAEHENWSVYLLGAEEHVINKTAQVVQLQFPKLNIAGYHHGYFLGQKEQKVIDDINSKSPDLLLVGLGSPIQERWIWENRDKLNVGAGFAIGGLFDFMSGEFPRAPLWMRKLGIEWMYRFLNDPGNKWKRIFIEIPLFIPLIIMAQLIPNKVK